MVSCGRSLVVLAAALLSISSLAAQDLPDYKLGDTVEQDIITPAPFKLIDLAGTTKLRDQIAAQMPVQLRFDISVASESEQAFRSEFAATRSNFLDNVQTVYGQRNLDTALLSSAGFERFTLWFQLHNQRFPADTNLLRAWAAGRSGQDVEESVAARLRRLMELPIYDPAKLPPDIEIGAKVNLTPPLDAARAPGASTNAVDGPYLPSKDLKTLTEAKWALRNKFPPPDSVLADYMVRFVQPNCTVDTNLTRRLRAERTGNLVATHSYAAGDVIARRGDKVDATILAALNVMKRQAADLQLRHDQEVRAKARRSRSWLLAACLVLFPIIFLLLWRPLWYKRQASGDTAGKDPGADSPSDSAGRQSR